ncbi:MAG: hypothetical protein L0170_18375 [Acidobacteria bacterium]|nr:hypothetical protein [Acidobacteriota bacterium]
MKRARKKIAPKVERGGGRKSRATALGRSLVVAALLRRGFDVFLSVAQDTAFDAVVVRGRRAFRLKVRGGRWRKGLVLFNRVDEHNADLLGITLHSGTVLFARARGIRSPFGWNRCVNCDKRFRLSRRKQRFHNEKCRNLYHRAQSLKRKALKKAELLKRYPELAKEQS